MSYISTVQYNSHQPHVGIEHLKCGSSNWTGYFKQRVTSGYSIKKHNPRTFKNLGRTFGKHERGKAEEMEEKTY